ncbi:hypothetical protein [Rhodanobacter lindaniclasticus]
MAGPLAGRLRLLVRSSSCLAARFSFSVFAGFFFSAFFESMPLLMRLLLDVDRGATKSRRFREAGEGGKNSAVRFSHLPSPDVLAEIALAAGEHGRRHDARPTVASSVSAADSPCSKQARLARLSATASARPNGEVETPTSP